MRDDAHEGRDDEAGGDRLDVVEHSEHPGIGRLEPDLLVRLAQRGRPQVAVLLGMMTTAGEGDLPAMMRQEVRPAWQPKVQLPGDRCGRARDGGPGLCGRDELPA